MFRTFGYSLWNWWVDLVSVYSLKKEQKPSTHWAMILNSKTLAWSASYLHVEGQKRLTVSCNRLSSPIGKVTVRIMFCKITISLDNWQLKVIMKFVVSSFGHSKQRGIISGYKYKVLYLARSRCVRDSNVLYRSRSLQSLFYTKRCFNSWKVR